MCVRDRCPASYSNFAIQQRLFEGFQNPACLRMFQATTIAKPSPIRALTKISVLRSLPQLVQRSKLRLINDPHLKQALVFKFPFDLRTPTI